jgi:hypothetical protein
MQLAYQFLERYPYNVNDLAPGPPSLLSFLFPKPPFAHQEDIMLSPWENEQIMNLISSPAKKSAVVDNGRKEVILLALLAGIIFFDDPRAFASSSIFTFLLLMVEISFGWFAGRCSLALVFPRPTAEVLLGIICIQIAFTD